jgi:hypothetical protein
MFVLTLAVDYEGEIILGVYSSHERAQTASEEFIVARVRALARSENFSIRPIEVDSPAEYHW